MYACVLKHEEVLFFASDVGTFPVLSKINDFLNNNNDLIGVVN